MLKFEIFFDILYIKLIAADGIAQPRDLYSVFCKHIMYERLILCHAFWHKYIHTSMHAQELILHKFSLVHIDQHHIIMQTLFSLSFLLELSFPWEFSIYACDNIVLALRHTKLNDFLFIFSVAFLCLLL